MVREAKDVWQEQPIAHFLQMNIYVQELLLLL